MHAWQRTGGSWVKIFFLDFEASSLDSDSYPIEIGWVGEDGQGESYLIQPHWSWRGWSKPSERVHQISQDMLHTATPADTVARRAQSVLSNSLIISDQPEFEQYWLETLMRVIGAPPFRVSSIHSLVGQEIKRVIAAIPAEPNSREWHRQARMLLDEAETAAAAAYEGANLGIGHSHRALPDAEALWRSWRAVVMAIDRLCELARE